MQMVRSSLSYNCRVLLECCRCSLLLQTVYTIRDGDIDYDLFPFLDFVSWFMPAYIFVILASRQRSQGMLLKLGMGNEEWVTGNRERESRNKCKAVTHLRIQSGGQRKEKEFETRGSVTAVNVSFYRLCPQMTRTFLLEHSPIGTGINKV